LVRDLYLGLYRPSHRGTWLAPCVYAAVQRAAGCEIGKDYPKPIVDHSSIVKINMGRMKAAYGLKQYGQVHTGNSAQHPLPPAMRQVGCAAAGDVLDGDRAGGIGGSKTPKRARSPGKPSSSSSSSLLPLATSKVARTAKQ
jgi:hypothetical protein